VKTPEYVSNRQRLLDVLEKSSEKDLGLLESNAEEGQAPVISDVLSLPHPCYGR
jgi:hypothetical protein